MNRFGSLRVFAAVVLLLGPGALRAQAPQEAWIRANAMPILSTEPGQSFRDLAPLGAMIGEARVVALGEATHGTREFFQLKHRILEYLVEEKGFTIFAIEAGMPECRVVNDYVLEGRGDPARALAGLYFWTWDTEEVLDMIRWMRRYNADPGHPRKVQFCGFDMQFTPAAYRNVKAFLDKVDPEEGRWMEERLSELGQEPVRGVRKPWKWQLTQAARALLEHFNARREAYARAGGGEAFAWARQDARILAQYTVMRSVPGQGVQVRDESMAENFAWLLALEPRAKVVLWAHNNHVSFDPSGALEGATSMGRHLRQTLGKDFFAMGFSFREGGFQAIDGGGGHHKLVSFTVPPQPGATLAEALASAGLPILALDLRALPAAGPVHDWFDRNQSDLDIGAQFDGTAVRNFVRGRKVTRHFDALCFVAKTTPARATPTGRRNGD